MTRAEPEWVYLDGEFVAAERARISVSDRSFLYGDGLFETIRLRAGEPSFWENHWQRLEWGRQFLKINSAFSGTLLRSAAAELAARNQRPEAILRLQISRGTGERGYSPKTARAPVIVMTLHPAPQLNRNSKWKLRTCPWRVSSSDPTLQHKTCNKLFHVLARADAEAHGANESLLMNERNEITETTSSNLFWFEGTQLCTAPLSCGVLPGITRAIVSQLCPDLTLVFEEKPIDAGALKTVDGIFLTQTSAGLVEVDTLDDSPIRSNPHFLILHRTFVDFVQSRNSRIS